MKMSEGRVPGFRAPGGPPPSVLFDVEEGSNAVWFMVGACRALVKGHQPRSQAVGCNPRVLQSGRGNPRQGTGGSSSPAL